VATGNGRRKPEANPRSSARQHPQWLFGVWIPRNGGLQQCSTSIGTTTRLGRTSSEDSGPTIEKASASLVTTSAMTRSAQSGDPHNTLFPTAESPVVAKPVGSSVSGTSRPRRRCAYGRSRDMRLGCDAAFCVDARSGASCTVAELAPQPYIGGDSSRRWSVLKTHQFTCEARTSAGAGTACKILRYTHAMCLLDNGRSFA